MCYEAANYVRIGRGSTQQRRQRHHADRRRTHLAPELLLLKRLFDELVLHLERAAVGQERAGRVVRGREVARRQRQHLLEVRAVGGGRKRVTAARETGRRQTVTFT